MAGTSWYKGNLHCHTTEVRASGDALSLEIERAGERSYATAVIGRDGVLLAEETGLAPCYRIRGKEVYVRARVTSSDGARAWTQPVMVQ